MFILLSKRFNLLNSLLSKFSFGSKTLFVSILSSLKYFFLSLIFKKLYFLLSKLKLKQVSIILNSTLSCKAGFFFNKFIEFSITFLEILFGNFLGKKELKSTLKSTKALPAMSIINLFGLTSL